MTILILLAIAGFFALLYLVVALWPEDMAVVCVECRGTGKVLSPSASSVHLTACLHCRGRGRVAL